MEDLTIKKDGKVIYDSQGSTLNPGGALDLIETVLDNTLNSQSDNIIAISIKSTPKSSVEQMELSTNKLSL